jgi:hypothetical protein
MMETERTSETSVYFNETARRYIPESSHLHPIYDFVNDAVFSSDYIASNDTVY